MHDPACPLCQAPGGLPVVQAARFRVIRAEEPGFPAFWRVVWQDHVAEFSDLDAADRALCMDAVARVERAVRDVLSPDKINLAALGNMVPHLHWHVVARWHWDSRFPAPIWAPPRREDDPAQMQALQARLAAADDAIRAALASVQA
ncbi:MULTISPECIES: HIT family protein [Ramlibacter]|uniref:HIT family protein n=1 Tax=Ramlibacter aquaticus TaxID=2780094 RepID=A0ABR9SB02_9BURK|nr:MULTISPECIES: HIT family protein [Ramlibacter]MBE7939537.1 HIT family protein [Ramlibacter aquaticus]